MTVRSDAMWISAAIVACLLGGELGAIRAQNRPERNGWLIRESRSADKVHFGIDYSRDGHQSNWSSDLPWTLFRNLDTGRLARLEGKHTFELVRDAGKFICTGVFSGGRGLGSYTFELSPGYAAELAKLGYGTPTGDQMIQMAMSDVTLELARLVKSSGLNATLRELVELRIHGVSPAYIRDTQAMGFTQLTARDYVEMKIHGVETQFMRDLKAAGYDLPVRQIVEMKIHGVDSRYMQELTRFGLKPNARDLVEMKIHGVSPEYLKGVTEAGYANLQTREVVEMKIHGVDPRFLKEARDMGYQFSLREVVEMRIHGVDSSYLRKLKDSGFDKLPASKIVQLKIHGVD